MHLDDLLKAIGGGIEGLVGSGVKDVEGLFGVHPQQPQAPQPVTKTQQPTVNDINGAVGGLYPTIQSQIDANNAKMGLPPSAQMQAPAPAPIIRPTQQNVFHGGLSDTAKGMLDQFLQQQNNGGFGKIINDSVVQPAQQEAGGALAQFEGKDSITANGKTYQSTPIQGQEQLQGVGVPEGVAKLLGAPLGWAENVASFLPGVGAEESAASDVARAAGAAETLKDAEPVVKAAAPGLPSQDTYEKVLQALNSSAPEDFGAGREGTKVVQGRVELGGDYGAELGAQVVKDLPNKTDRIALGDYLDDPTTKVSPQIQAVADRVKPILEQADQIRSASDPGYHSVTDYFTRALKGDTDLRSYKFDPDTPYKGQYSKSRNLDKFTDEQGNSYILDPRQNGLKQVEDTNKYVTRDGNTFTRTKATRAELRTQGVPLEDDASKVLSKYFSDTFKVKEHANYLENVKAKLGIDPAKVPQSEVADAVDKGYRTVHTKGLEGILFDAKTADALDAMTKSGPDNIFKQVFRGLSGSLRNLAVTNPIVHPLNLEFQALTGVGLRKIPRLLINQARQGGLGEFRDDPYYAEFKAAGGNGMGLHGTHFARDFVRKLAPDSRTARAIADKMDGWNPVSLNSKIVNHADDSIRVALYRTLRETGSTPKEAIGRIDNFLGDYGKALGKNEQVVANTLFFYRWLKTEANTLRIAADLRHPETLGTMAVIGGMLYGVEQAWKSFTGNPNATIRYPGVYGLIKDLTHIPGQLREGQVPSVVTSHVNPVIEHGAEQIANKDFFTGQQIQKPGQGPGARLGWEVGETAGQSAEGKFVNGNKTGLEKTLNFFGLNTPHTASSPAAPNLPILNKDGVQPATGADPSGIQEATSYNQAKNEALKGLTQQQDIDTFNRVLDKLLAPDGSTKILNDGKTTLSIASDLYSSPNALTAIQKMQQQSAKNSGEPLDPKWQLDGSGTDLNNEQNTKISIYEHYESLPTGDPGRTVLEDKNPWIKQLTQDRQQYFAQNPAQTGNDLSPDGQPQFPSFGPDLQGLMTQYDGLTDSTQKAAMLNDHPELADAFEQISQYTNSMRRWEGAPPLPQFPTESAPVKATIAAYQAIPKGQKGAWIKANPTAYKAMNDYFTQVTMYNLLKSASVDAISGEPVSQKLLKSAYDLGKYDIIKNADGSFSLGDSYSSGSGFGSKSSHLKKPRFRVQKTYAKRMPKFYVKHVHMKVKHAHVYSNGQTVSTHLSTAKQKSINSKA